MAETDRAIGYSTPVAVLAALGVELVALDTALLSHWSIYAVERTVLDICHVPAKLQRHLLNALCLGYLSI